MYQRLLLVRALGPCHFLGFPDLQVDKKKPIKSPPVVYRYKKSFSRTPIIDKFKILLKKTASIWPFLSGWSAPVVYAKDIVPPSQDMEFRQKALSFQTRMITGKKLRSLYPAYQAQHIADDADWYHRIFKRIPQKELQKPLASVLAQEGNFFDAAKNQVDWIIMFGDEDMLLKDIADMEFKTTFVTFNGVEEDCNDPDTYDHMNALHNEGGDHHPWVSRLTVTDPDTGERKTFFNPEFTRNSYTVLCGVRTEVTLPDGSVTSNYNYHTIDDVYLVLEIHRPKDNDKPTPLKLLSWWWYHLDERIWDYRERVAGGNSRDYLQFLTDTPVALLGYGLDRLPINNGIGAGYDEKFIPWSSLPHKHQEEPEEEFGEYKPQTTRSNFPNITFKEKHVLQVPTTLYDKGSWPYKEVHINSTEDMFLLDNEAIGILKGHATLNTAIIWNEKDSSKKFDKHMFKAFDIANGMHSSYTQKYPVKIPGWYGIWNLKGDDIVFHENTTYSLHDPKGDNWQPWNGRQELFGKILEREKKRGGSIGGINTEINPENPSGPFVINRFNVQRTFLARDWRFYAFVDDRTGIITHFDAMWPKRVPRIKDTGNKANYKNPGAERILGGRPHHQQELNGYAVRVGHNHNCKTRARCQECNNLNKELSTPIDLEEFN